jgi:hypothetical protein
MSPRRVHDLERGPRLAPHAETARGLATTPVLTDHDEAVLRTHAARRAVAEDVAAWPGLSALPLKLSSFVGRHTSWPSSVTAWKLTGWCRWSGRAASEKRGWPWRQRVASRAATRMG